MDGWMDKWLGRLIGMDGWGKRDEQCEVYIACR